MIRLYVHLYLDEDVDVLLADLLRARGHKVVTTLEASNLGSSDDDQLLYAASQQWALMTHNRVDYEALALQYWESGRHHSGLIIATHQNVYQLRDRLLPHLEQFTADDLDDQILYI